MSRVRVCERGFTPSNAKRLYTDDVSYTNEVFNLPVVLSIVTIYV